MDVVFEALAHPIRRQILALLKNGARTAGELSAAFGVSKPTMSSHFAKLREAGLVQSEQRGASVVYSVNLSVLEDVILAFMDHVGAGAPKPKETPCPVNA